VALQSVHKEWRPVREDPDRRVQAAIQLAIEKVAGLGSVRQALFWFLQHKLDLPTRINGGPYGGGGARYSTIHEFISNPRLRWRIRLWQNGGLVAL
jgi:hypothetical protein